ncbi:MAG: hypothetical protein JO075_11730 [Acidimicrobiia bacterium]|nr:hypothetical protein [Acidimicrobiia bacterium]
MRVVFPPQGGAAPALVVLRGGAYATSHGSGAGAAEWAAENGMVPQAYPAAAESSLEVGAAVRHEARHRTLAAAPEDELSAALR